MARCSECGAPAGVLMSMCRTCIEAQETARREGRSDSGSAGMARGTVSGAGAGFTGRLRAAGAGFGFASIAFSALPAFVTLAAYAKYLFEARSHAWGEDMMGYGIIAVFISPLALIGFVLAFWAKSMRNTCLGLALIYILGIPLLALFVG